MLGRVLKDNPMRWVTQKGRSARLAAQDARLALLAQVEIQIRLGRHPAHQTLRLMDVEIVDHKPPARRSPIARHHALDVSQEIRLCAGGTAPRRKDLATYHVATQDKRTGAMPNILKFPSL